MSEPVVSLDDLLSRWRDLNSQGRSVSLEQLCLDCPSQLAALRAHVDAVASMMSFLEADESLRLGVNCDESTAGVADGERGSRIRTASPAGYEILGELGRGGMGVVYKARQIGLDRIVALKMVLAGVHAGPEELVRFRAEAEAVAKLRHPHIVQIYEIDECQGLPFLSLEYMNGGTLGQRLRTGPLAPLEAAELVEKLARAMEVAHQLGIVHRDLKPANVLFQTNETMGPGIPKITDFGLVRHLDSVGPTATEAVLGTPGYMAPEQASGHTKTAGPLADVYALGGMLYACLTARPPFQGPNLVDTLDQVRNQEPVPPKLLQPNVPRDLETICIKCLQKSPERRYATARDLADDLRRFLDGTPILARPTTRLERAVMWARRQPAVAALWCVSLGAMVVLLAAGLWFSVRMIAANARVEEHYLREKAASELAEIRKYYALMGSIHECIARRRAGWTWQALDEIAQAAKLPNAVEHLSELRGDAAQALSTPDIRLVGSVGKGFRAETLAFDPTGRFLALGQSRAQAFVSCTVQLVDLEQGNKTQSLTFMPSQLIDSLFAQSQEGVRSLAFSPDGKWLIAGTAYGWLQIWDLSQEPPALTSRQAHHEVVREVLFSADGKAVFTGDKEGILKRWETGSWKETHQVKLNGEIEGLCFQGAKQWLCCGADKQVHLLAADDLSRQRKPAQNFFVRPVCARDGSWFAYGDLDYVCFMRGNLNTVDRTLSAEHYAPSHPDSVSDLGLSPDESILATASVGEVRLWEISSGHLVARLPVGKGRLDYHPRKDLLAVLADRETLLYEIRPRSIQTYACGSSSRIRACDLARDGRVLAIAREDLLERWSLDEAGHFLGCKTQPIQCDSMVATDPTGSIVGTMRDRTPIFTNFDNKDLHSMRPSNDSVRGMTFGTDGKLWMAAGQEIRALSYPDGRVTSIWSAAAVRQLVGSSYPTVLAVGEHWVASGSVSGMLYLIDAETGKSAGVWPVFKSPVRSIAITDDEQLAYLGSESGEIAVVRIPAGEIIQTIQAHDDRVTALAICRDRLISGSNDLSLRMWHRTATELRDWLRIRTSNRVNWLGGSTQGDTFVALLNNEIRIRQWDTAHLQDNMIRLGLDDDRPQRKDRP